MRTRLSPARARSTPTCGSAWATSRRLRSAARRLPTTASTTRCSTRRPTGRSRCTTCRRTRARRSRLSCSTASASASGTRPRTAATRRRRCSSCSSPLCRGRCRRSGHRRRRGHEIDGPEVEVHEIEVHEIEGHEVEVHEIDGHEVDGHEVEDHDVAGPEVEGHEVAGPEVNGPEVEGPDVEGPKGEGTGCPVFIYVRIGIYARGLSYIRLRTNSMKDETISTPASPPHSSSAPTTTTSPVNDAPVLSAAQIADRVPEPGSVRPQRGDELELRIESIAFGGEGVARLGDGGYVVFVAGAVPGDLVRAVVHKRKRSYAHARTLEVLEPSPERIAAVANHPGVPWQVLPYERQLQIKQSQVDEALKRIGHL